MMSCTILYVWFTEDLIGQANERRLLSLLNYLEYNMRIQKSLFIITNPKENKLLLIGKHLGPLGHFSALFNGFHH